MVRVVTIEAWAVVPATVGQVWQALLDQPRWTGCLPESSPTRLEHVALVDGTFGRVGDRRRCAAVLSGLPLVGRRRLTWEERITDAERDRTLEVEALPSRDAIRRWRVRFWLVAQPDGQTRVRCHVGYRAGPLRGWLVDRLFLRRRVTVAAQTWLANLTASFGQVPVEEAVAPEAREAREAAEVAEALAAA